jgi:hypothetical protein
MKKALLLLALPALLLSCHNFEGKRIRGDGNVQTHDRPVNSFKKIELTGSAKVLVTQGDNCSVKIEADENLQHFIEVVQEGDRVIIRNRPGFNLSSTDDIRIYVTAPVFSSFDISGAGDVVGQNKITSSDDLSIEFSGVGNVRMELDVPAVKGSISGAGNIDLKGQTKDVDLELSGIGSAHCFDLKAENAKVEISGIGSAEVFASVHLAAEVSGAGSVEYKGNPGSIDQHVSGAGSIHKAE